MAQEKRLTSPIMKYEHSNVVTTVAENRKGYTNREFEDAKRARKLYHILGAPSTENFKKILRQNLIKNCPVTVDHVNIAEKILVQILQPKKENLQGLSHQEL